MTAAALLSLTRVAELCGGRVEGDGDHAVAGVASLDAASADEMGLLASRRYLKAARASGAGALLVAEALAGELDDRRPRVVVEDPHAALVPILRHLHPEPGTTPAVHPTAVLGAGASLGEGVTVGPYAVVGEGARVGDGATLHAHVVVGRGAVVGRECTLHPHVTLYPEVRLGDRVILHAGAVLGSDGFGYAVVDGLPRKVPQVGGCVVEDDVEIGANTCVDRGSIGETRLGRGTKLDNLVQVAHNVETGPSCMMAAQSGVAGSTRLGAGVVMGGQSGSVGHVTLGDGVRVAAKSAVASDTPAGQTVMGFPAREQARVLRATALTLKLPELLKRLRELERRVAELDPPGGGPA